MKNNLCQVIIIISLSLFFFVSDSVGSVMSRSSGFGLRVYRWMSAKSSNEYDQGPFVQVEEYKSLYIFSRLQGNLFLETTLGGMIEISREMSNGNEEYGNLGAFLFGLRYDLPRARSDSKYKPYMSLGAGTYWTTVERHVNYDSIMKETDAKLGLYFGGGLNIAPRSWFALNFDLKYHYIDLYDTVLDDFTGLEFGLGCSFMIGNKPEIFQIENVKIIVEDIYPAYYKFYNTYPLALVMVKNIVNYPIEVNVRSNISGYSEHSQESGFIHIERGETKDIPVRALFGTVLLQTTRRQPAVIDLEVEARSSDIRKKSRSAQIMIHNRNAWTGEIDKLGFFVTPDDKHITETSREIVKQTPETEKSEMKNLSMAKALFNDLQEHGIRYQTDPNIPFYRDDRVQFATETKVLGGGDCDDLAVLFASMLESVGINTAFVEVQDPQKDIAHLYLMFDSGLEANRSTLISSNEKQYVIRDRSPERKEVWIPVETTLIERGFDEAWKAGAMAYLQEGLLRDGIADNWVRIIDVENNRSPTGY